MRRRIQLLVLLVLLVLLAMLFVAFLLGFDANMTKKDAIRTLPTTIVVSSGGNLESWAPDEIWSSRIYYPNGKLVFRVDVPASETFSLDFTGIENYSVIMWGLAEIPGTSIEFEGGRSYRVSFPECPPETWIATLILEGESEEVRIGFFLE